MNKRIVAGAFAGLLLLTTAACSSSDDKAEDTTTTTAEAKDTTTTEAATDTTEATAGDTSLTAEETTCITDAAVAEPALTDYGPDTIATAPQATQEVYYTIVLNCAGGPRIIDFFMIGFASTAPMDEAGLACVRTVVEGMPAEDGVKLLSGDADVKATLTSAIQTACV